VDNYDAWLGGAHQNERDLRGQIGELEAQIDGLCLGHSDGDVSSRTDRKRKAQGGQIVWNIYSEDLPIVMTYRMCFPHNPDDYVGYLILRKPRYCRGMKMTAVLISPVLHRRSATTTIVTISRQIIILQFPI